MDDVGSRIELNTAFFFDPGFSRCIETNNEVEEGTGAFVSDEEVEVDTAADILFIVDIDRFFK